MAKLALLLLLAQSIAGVSVPPRMGHPVVEDQDDQPARSLEDEQERREGDEIIHDDFPFGENR